MADVTARQVEDGAIHAMDRGWFVFPSRGKIPATPNGVKDASTDMGRVRDWWSMPADRGEERGIGLATGTPSGVWVLDIDGEAGQSALRELQRSHGKLPETVTARTKHGFHLFFQMPKDGDVRNSAGRVAPGVDVRGTGGYVVIPPSEHPDGGRYAWVEGHSPDESAIAAAPDWLLSLVTAPKRRTDGPAAPVEAEIPRGRRNDELASLAGSMRRRGMEAPEILSALHTVNDRRCKPPLPTSEVETIADSIARYPPALNGRPAGAREAGGNPEVEGLPAPVCALGAEVPPPPAFLVGRLLLDRDLNLVASDGGVGKTSTVLAVCGAYAAGVPPFGHPDFGVPSEGGDVLFVSEEDGLGVLLNRLQALIAGHGWESDRVLGRTHLFAQAGVSLDDDAWQSHLLNVVKGLERPLVVFDPLAELTLAKENSNDETKPIVRFLRLLTTDAGATVVLLHHAGKAAEGKRKIDRAVRGASAWYSAARAVYLLDRTGLGVSVECLKMNRAEMPPRFVLKRDVKSEPDNRAAWTHATLTYLEETAADDLVAERFVLDLLERHPKSTSTAIRDAAKTADDGPSQFAVSDAIAKLQALNRIRYEPGPRNSKKWYVSGDVDKSADDPAEPPRQGTLPTLPDPAGQGGDTPRNDPADPVTTGAGSDGGGGQGAGQGGQGDGPNDYVTVFQCTSPDCDSPVGGPNVTCATCLTKAHQASAGGAA